MAKGKKVLFVLILEILDGDRAQSRSFWEVPKKRRCRRPIKPKKPKVTLGVAPVASEKPEVSPTATMVAQAILKKPDRVEEDAMTGVEPSVSADPPPSRSSSPLPPSVKETRFLDQFPFPCEFDHARIAGWLNKAKKRTIRFRDLGAVVRAAGHTDPDRLQRIQALIAAAALPPPPPFIPPLPHSPGRVESGSRHTSVITPFGDASLQI